MRLRGVLYEPGINGLGVRGIHRLPYRRLFDSAARKHDAAYDETGNGRARRDADWGFLADMLQVCETPVQRMCAYFYFGVVRAFGWAFYRYNR